MTSVASRGRPPASSRDTLQDAAFELFLENGYAGTTVEQITQRAGVSRNTFFNYFASKSDVFWVELDEALEGLAATLRQATAHEPRVDSAVAAILALGRSFGPSRVPFALTQHRLIGSVHELQASALRRFTRQAGILEEFLADGDGGPGLPAAEARAAAYALIAAVIAGAQSWAEAGTGRGELGPYLRAALGPVARGFASGPPVIGATRQGGGRRDPTPQPPSPL